MRAGVRGGSQRAIDRAFGGDTVGGVRVCEWSVSSARLALRRGARACRGVVLAHLVVGSARGQDAPPGFLELRHPATGAVTALVVPAAARNHGEPLPGFARQDRPPNAILHANTTRPALDATVRAAARRFGLAQPDAELAFQHTHTDALLMVHEGWAQQVRGVPVFGAGLIVHRNARGEVTSIGGRVLPKVVPSFSSQNATNADATREPDGTVPRAKALDYISAAQAVAIGRAAAAQSRPALQRAKPSGESARENVLRRADELKLGTTLSDGAREADGPESSPRASARKSAGTEGPRVAKAASDELKLGTTLGEPVLWLYNEAFLNGQEASAAETWLVWKFNLRNGEDEPTPRCARPASISMAPPTATSSPKPCKSWNWINPAPAAASPPAPPPAPPSRCCGMK